MQRSKLVRLRSENYLQARFAEFSFVGGGAQLTAAIYFSVVRLRASVQDGLFVAL